MCLGVRCTRICEGRWGRRRARLGVRIPVSAKHIEAQIRRAVGVTMRSVCDVIEHRRNSFELYGFDFLVDHNHGVWLLEANSSPDMSRTAAPLRQIVDDGLEEGGCF